MKYAITGSTGNFGSAVISFLLDQGIPPSSLIGVARNGDKASHLKEKGVDVRLADYGDYAALVKAFTGADRVLLVSGSEVGKRFEQHKNVIDAAREAGARQILYTSITRADSSANILAPEHRQTEEYLRGAGIEYVILRNNWYTENYVNDVRIAKEYGVIATATGRGRVASAGRKEYAEAAACALTGQGHGGKIYELAGKPWTFEELADAASSLHGREIVYGPVSTEERKKLLLDAGVAEDIAGFLSALDASIAEGSLDIESDDLKDLLGRPPESLAATLKELI